jgi:pimeloyl-ACP methyl ester carboxylesterase
MTEQICKEDYNTIKTKFIDLQEGRLAYDDTGGTGPLVIMLPGMGALRSEYRYLAPALCKSGYRVVTLDLRGQGESDSKWSEFTIPAVGQDILQLIDHLDAGPAHVIGTSFSPGAVIWAAAERPEAIQSLILISPFVRDAKISLGQRIALAILLRGPWKVRNWITYYRSLYPTHKPADFDEYLMLLKQNLDESGRFDAMMTLGSSSRKSSEERFDKINQPVLVIMGSKDPDWPEPEVEAHFIVEALSAELLMVDGAGHYPQTEMPEKVTPTIKDFLSRVQTK